MLYKFGRFPAAVKVAEKQKLFHSHTNKFLLCVSTSSDIHVQRTLDGIQISRLRYFRQRAVGGEHLNIEQLIGKHASMGRYHLIHQKVKAEGKEDVILSIASQFLNDITSGRKKAEYQKYSMPDLKRIWYTPIGSNGRIVMGVRVKPSPKAVNGRYEYVYQYLHFI